MNIIEKHFAKETKGILGDRALEHPTIRALLDAGLSALRSADERFDAADKEKSWTLEDVGRACSAIMRAVRRWQKRRVGARTLEWRPARGAPASRRTEYGWDWKHVRWRDHAYREVWPADARRSGEAEVLWVSEPYDLDAEALRELLALHDEGWIVTVRGAAASHFPGETLRVEILRRP